MGSQSSSVCVSLWSVWLAFTKSPTSQRVQDNEQCGCLDDCPATESSACAKQYSLNNIHWISAEYSTLHQSLSVRQHCLTGARSGNQTISVARLHSEFWIFQRSRSAHRSPDALSPLKRLFRTFWTSPSDPAWSIGKLKPKHLLG